MIGCQLTLGLPTSSTMVAAAKRKGKKTLTKINPSVLLRARSQAVSQHSGCDGIRVTTAVNPVRQLPAALDPLLDPVIFSTDAPDLNGELSEDDGGDEVSRKYYVARVRTFRSFYFTHVDSSPPPAGQSTPTVDA